MAQNKRDTSYRVPIDFRACAYIKKRRAWFIRSGRSNIAYTGCSFSNSADLGIFKRLASGVMGSNHRKSRRNIVTSLFGKRARNGNKSGAIGRFIRDSTGDAVVEATILFPIMIMIFAALVLLAIYLPARAVLQRATQYATTAIATENSDTWLFFDESSMSYFRESDKSQLKNVYADLFTGSGDIQSKGETITIEIESRGISSKAGQLVIESYVVNKILYKEVVTTATREFPMPVDLSFVGFPEMISITATSTVVVQNADEFVRNIDMASDFAEFINERYDLTNIMDAISSFGSRVTGILGW